MSTKSKADNLALVRRPSSAVEKAKPGAKRILSGMVADTLALAKSAVHAKPVFLVLAGADHWVGTLNVLLKDRYEVKILEFKTDTELKRLARAQQFNLICLYLGNIHWTEFQATRPSDWLTNDSFLDYMVGTLASLKRTYGKPIIAMQAMDWADMFSGTGVSFFQTPWDVQEMRKVLDEFANVPDSKP